MATLRRSVQVQMTMENNSKAEVDLRALSLLVFCPERSAEAVHYVAGKGASERADFFRLADDHHVVIRALQPFQQQARAIGDAELAGLAQAALDREHDRIAHALAGLDRVCTELHASGCAVTVIKTLDHWPDFGSDLDLFTMGDEHRVVHVLKNILRARRCMLTLSDRIAHKRSYAVPGLSEQVELHINRLGHVGEHIELARRFIARRQAVNFNQYTFQLPAPEERVIAATLQRMYRSLCLRLCDVCNTAGLIERRMLDFGELRGAAEEAGIWTGVATYLTLVAGYVKKYRGDSLELPEYVTESAGFGVERTFVRGKFFTFPARPYGLSLYFRQLRHAAHRRDIPGTARLSLVPPLASIGAFAEAVIGNSDRVW